MVRSASYALAFASASCPAFADNCQEAAQGDGCQNFEHLAKSPLIVVGYHREVQVGHSNPAPEDAAATAVVAPLMELLVSECPEAQSLVALAPAAVDPSSSIAEVALDIHVGGDRARTLASCLAGTVRASCLPSFVEDIPSKDAGFDVLVQHLALIVVQHLPCLHQWADYWE